MSCVPDEFDGRLQERAKRSTQFRQTISESTTLVDQAEERLHVSLVAWDQEVTDSRRLGLVHGQTGVADNVTTEGDFLGTEEELLLTEGDAVSASTQKD